jgi:hypothetical protein
LLAGLKAVELEPEEAKPFLYPQPGRTYYLRGKVESMLVMLTDARSYSLFAKNSDPKAAVALNERDGTARARRRRRAASGHIGEDGAFG